MSTLDQAPDREDGNDKPEVVSVACPECGQEFPTPGALGAHRKAKHGVQSQRERDGKTDRKDGEPNRRRRTAENRQTRRQRMVAETIRELVEFADQMRGRPTVEARELADVLRRDADKLAMSLSWVAERVNPVGWFIDRTMGHGGVITVARGFNGVAGWLVSKWRLMLAEREQERQEALYLQSEEEAVAPPDDGSAAAG